MKNMILSFSITTFSKGYAWYVHSQRYLQPTHSQCVFTLNTLHTSYSYMPLTVHVVIIIHVIRKSTVVRTFSCLQIFIFSLHLVIISFHSMFDISFKLAFIFLIWLLFWCLYCKGFCLFHNAVKYSIVIYIIHLHMLIFSTRT